MANNDIYKEIKYYALATDPIHIGTGGYRLARVDNTIVRDPVTNIPKIPGSGISGVCRAYSAMAHNKYLYKDKNGTLFSCAGKGGEKGEQHCGQHNCEICTTFGFSKGEAKQSFQGLVQFFDAKIIFFPVHTMIGPVWITSASVLKEINIQRNNCEKDKFIPFGNDPRIPINFGWLILENKPKENITFPDELNDILPVAIKNNLFQVEDAIFSELVNSNLEVRTSVSIDPETGASVEGALFTYEAIPAGTVLSFVVIINNPKNFRVYDESKNPKQIQHGGKDANIQSTQTIVEEGLGWIAFLGIGGMGTRGFGRMKILNLKQGVKNEQ